MNNLNMQIKSPAFKNEGEIPSRFTCDGEGVNPALIFKNAPKETKSLTLTVDDPDIPESVKKSYNIEVWDHWIIWNISPNTKEIQENSIPEGAVVGEGTRGVNAYTPPCPPDREHRYFFKLYALNVESFEANGKADFYKKVEQYAVAKAELMGVYKIS